MVIFYVISVIFGLGKGYRDRVCVIFELLYRVWRFAYFIFGRRRAFSSL